MRELFASLVIGIACGAVVGTLGSVLFPGLPAATCPSEPADAWIQRRMLYCREACVSSGVGMPFDVDVSEKSARCVCFRLVERVKPMRLERVPNEDE